MKINLIFSLLKKKVVNLALIRCAGSSPWQDTSRTASPLRPARADGCVFGVPLWASQAAQQRLLAIIAALADPRDQIPCTESTTTQPSPEQSLLVPLATSRQHDRSHLIPLRPVLPLFPVWFSLYVLIPNYYKSFILLSHRSSGLHYLFIIAIILRNPQLGRSWRGGMLL